MSLAFFYYYYYLMLNMFRVLIHPSSGSRNCVIPVVRVRTLGSVGSRTQLSLRCNFSDYVLRNGEVLTTPPCKKPC